MLEIENDDKIYPFSRGILARTLLPTGLSINTVYEIAEEVQRECKDEKKPVPSSELREMVAHILDKRELIKERKRYLFKKQFSQVKKPIVILIGGVAGIGKSTVAAGLAWRLGIERVIDTDEIREIMRYTLPEDLLPELHQSSFDAGKSVAGPDVEKNELVGFSRQAHLVNRGVHAYIKRVAKEGIKTIFNGVHLVPGLMEMKQKENSISHFDYLLTLRNKEDHIRRFNSRSEQSYRKADRYVEKIEQIRKIQEYAVKRAEESDTKMIENINLDDTLTAIVDDMIDKQQDEFTHE